MSNIAESNIAETSTQAPQKKNVVYRLLAVLFIAVAVGVFFLDVNLFVGEYGLFFLGEVSLFDLIKHVKDAPDKLFGFLPQYAVGKGFYSILLTGALYAFVLGLVTAIVLCFAAIFTAKRSPALLRAALFVLAWGAAIYTLSITYFSNYCNMTKTTFDWWTIALCGVAAIGYFALVVRNVGKKAWINALNFLLAFFVSALLAFALTKNGDVVFVTAHGKTAYKWLLRFVLVYACLNVFVASFRVNSKKGFYFDLGRYFVQLIATVFAIAVNSITKMDNGDYVLFTICALVVALFQVGIGVKQLIEDIRRKAKAAADQSLASFETQEYVEAYPYEGGPVAGVEIAEEITPTNAAAQAARNPEEARKASAASLLGNGFDPFLISLNEREKEEFLDLYVVRCKGDMPEIPGYVVGGDNKEFFNRVFIYLGQYREKIPSNLLSKMYKFSMKL